MASQTSPGQSLYKGSCHCGFVTYTAQLDLFNPSPDRRESLVTKCNCTICCKSGAVLATPNSKDGLTLLTPVEGESALGDYMYNTKSLHHYFCPKCGIKCFLKGVFHHQGKDYPVVRVNILTLDGKADGSPMEDFRDIKIMYWNAKYNLDDPPADKPYEGGIW
ncbi:hypothetical protein VTK26DRAFT_6463 [Humicola hyalothermophila]